MLSRFRCHGLALEGDVIKKVAGERWDTAAMFEVRHPTNFQFSWKLVSGKPEYLFGIAPTGVDLAAEDLEQQAGFFLNADVMKRCFFIVHSGRRCKITLPGADELLCSEAAYWSDGAPERTGPMPLGGYLQYKEGELHVGIEGFSSVKVPLRIPNASYRPCICLGPSGVQFRIAVSSPMKRQRTEDTGIAASKILKSLWDDRSFSDAFVVCGQVSLPVHRCVLSKASRFFASAFEAPMREGHESKVVINDACEEAVRELIRYLYTGDVSESADFLKLLPLAHRFEASGLVRMCGMGIVDGLCQDNVAKAMAVMRSFREDEIIKEHWGDALERIRSDRALTEALATQTFGL